MNQGVNSSAKDRAAEVASQLVNILPFLKASAQQRDRLCEPVTDFAFVLQYLDSRPRSLLIRLSRELYEIAGEQKIYCLGKIFSEMTPADYEVLATFLSMVEHQAILNFYTKNIENLKFLAKVVSEPLAKMRQGRVDNKPTNEPALQIPQMVPHRYIATDLGFSDEEEVLAQKPKPLLISKSTAEGIQQVEQTPFIIERKGGLARTKSFDSFNLAALGDELEFFHEAAEPQQGEEKPSLEPQTPSIDAPEGQATLGRKKVSILHN